MDYVPPSALPPRPRSMWRAVIPVAFAAVCAFLVAGTPAKAQAQAAVASAVTCTTGQDVPVALAPGQPQAWHVAGELCATPAELADGGTVQLALHGATYDYRYFDFGTVNGVLYSYAQSAAAAGIPVFTIDQLGAGYEPGLSPDDYSSYPPAADITIQVAAYVEHQVVQALRSGQVGGTHFGRVVEVGHSYGSVTTILEAGTYGDVAGVILTGFTHASTVFETDAQPDLYPAYADPMPMYADNPMFASTGPGATYMTTVTGTRGHLFYNPADSDPQVIAQDELTKSTISLTEFLSGLQVMGSNYTASLNVPVLEVDGSNDQLSCGATTAGGTYDCSSGAVIAAQEAPYFSAAAQLRACAITGAGHDINLASNYQDVVNAAIAWTYEYVGVGNTQLASRTLPAYCSS